LPLFLIIGLLFTAWHRLQQNNAARTTRAALRRKMKRSAVPGVRPDAAG
jgi:hypothetical protein